MGFPIFNRMLSNKTWGLIWILWKMFQNYSIVRKYLKIWPNWAQHFIRISENPCLRISISGGHCHLIKLEKKPRTVRKPFLNPSFGIHNLFSLNMSGSRGKCTCVCAQPEKPFIIRNKKRWWHSRGGTLLSSFHDDDDHDTERGCTQRDLCAPDDTKGCLRYYGLAVLPSNK